MSETIDPTDISVVEDMSVIALGLEDDRALCDGFTLYLLGRTILAVRDDGSVSLHRVFDAPEEAKSAFAYVLFGDADSDDEQESYV